MVLLDPDQLLASLRDTAHALTTANTVRDRDATLTGLVHAAVTTIAHAQGGGISRTEAGTVASAHASSDDIGELDRLQSRLGQGPCISAADDPPDSGFVFAHDLDGADRARWPSFAPAAVRAGYRSLLSVQLSQHGRRRSALNLYAHDPHVFDQAAQLTAGLLGLQAGMLLHGADHAADLSRALATRDVIGQAKGILMERFTVTDQHAFRMLVRASQDTNVKLVDVARWLAHEADRAAHPGSPPDTVSDPTPTADGCRAHAPDPTGRQERL